MTQLIHTATGEPWRGESIGSVAYPVKVVRTWSAEKLARIGLEHAPVPVPAPFVPTADDVNAECGRRIYALFPIHKQLNAQARATELLLVGPTNWSEQERAEAAYIQSARDWIKAMREVSDDLAGADGIDPTFGDDKHWPTFPLPTEE